MMDNRELIVLLLLGALSGYLVYPFIDAIFFGVLTAYALKVLIRRLGERFDRRWAEVVLSLSVIGIVTGGVYIIVTQASAVTMEIVKLSEQASGTLSAFLRSYNLESLSSYVSQATTMLETMVRSRIFSIASGVPGLFLSVFLYFVVTFFAYRDGERVYEIADGLVGKLPEEDEKFVRDTYGFIMKLIKDVFIVYGSYSLLVAIIAGIGFYFIGVFVRGAPLPFFWFWAFMCGLAAFLRGFASGVFLGPIIMYYFVAGELWFAFWLLLFSVVFLWLLPEAFILPYLGASKINESYIVLLLGFTAGVLVLGFKGIILGPVILITFKHILQEQLELF